MQNNKIAVISDVHSNYEALTSVLSHAESQGAHELWFLGDAIGYGPHPQRCLKLLQEIVTRPNAWIKGNHDEALKYPLNGSEYRQPDNEMKISEKLRSQLDPLALYIGQREETIEAFRFNYDIMEAYPSRREYLLSRPTQSHIEPFFCLFHGGLRSGTPTTTYIRDSINLQSEFFLSLYCITDETLEKLEEKSLPPDTIQALTAIKDQEFTGEDLFVESLKTVIGDILTQEYEPIISKFAFVSRKQRYQNPASRIFLFGHTHEPVGYWGEMDSGSDNDKVEFFKHEMKPGVPISLGHRHIWFINPGSVGQPRDGDSRASYLIIDGTAGTAQVHRVEYNIHAVQKQMEDYKMPDKLIKRLSEGR